MNATQKQVANVQDLENRVKNITNQIQSRADLWKSMFNEKRDIDSACGYPDLKMVQPEDYRAFYDDFGIASRVVEMYPEACWEEDPEYKETEDADNTEWEEAVDKFDTEHMLNYYLHRVDTISGIGSFGVLFFGLDDGLNLDQPVEGVADDDKVNGSKLGTHEVTFIRALDQSLVKVNTLVNDNTSPRNGLPETYNVSFTDPSVDTQGTAGGTTTQTKVHWTRLIHITDLRVSSEVFGQPRMRNVFHRLWDLRKILGGSGEMFWQGAFPGISFETNSDTSSNAAIDLDAMKEQLEKYIHGVQRYLATEGVHANQLQPNIESPLDHIRAQLMAIAVALSVPFRIFMGSEEAKLASEQDLKGWLKRVARRRKKYLTPMICRPVIDRLMAYGAIPYVESYEVKWPDLHERTEEDKVNKAEKVTKALAMYIQSGLDSLISPLDYLTKILEMDLEEAEAIVDAMEDVLSEEEEEQARLEEAEAKLLAENPPQPPASQPGTNGQMTRQQLLDRIPK